MYEFFKDKVALVTGGGSGMGRATARAFAKAGATVVVADISDKSVHASVDDIVDGAGKALGICCDVADEAQVAAMVQQTVSTFGRLDAAFNNAGNPAL
jgi:NAD(P)-dependent dehydrogenase (short-subunit alcohol dehydrogenase family)